MLEVGVGHDDHVVLAAGICRDALVVRAALTVDILADMRRPDEADRGDFRVPQDRVDDFLIAVDRVPDAIRQPRLTPQLAEKRRRAGNRTAERRVGTECVSTGTSRWSSYQ